MIEQLKTNITEWLLSLGTSNDLAIIITDYSFFTGLIILSVFFYFVAKKLLLSTIHKLTEKSPTNWDDILAKKGAFKILAYFVPLYILYTFTSIVLNEYPVFVSGLEAIVSALMILVVLLTVNAIINAVSEIYSEFEIAKRRSIKGYVQVVKIIVFTIGGILILTNLFGIENPSGIVGGLGAFSAVLLLVFKDPILGFVGGIQLSANNMLSPGDWISMPEYNTDGTVIDIALTTVKVQNWDKTISTIPTYSLISNSFRNWKGMEDSGGRRIKRHINLDMKSIRFCTKEMLEKYNKIEYVTKYVGQTEKRLVEYNAARNVDNNILVNGRRQTNIGVFRAYLRGYLHNHPMVHDNMTFLVRQLQPSEKGLPIEIYVFSKDQEWANYEDLQSDLFDHILAVIPEFDLRVFQNPTGDDFSKLVG
ncbi:MAG: mechanosensitive ion channel family protein [Bacteroidetes bacterium]|nr:MAG: mechanosensitive ion channel family protein [Bacteroidota bacterium]